MTPARKQVHPPLTTADRLEYKLVSAYRAATPDQRRAFLVLADMVDEIERLDSQVSCLENRLGELG